MNLKDHFPRASKSFVAANPQLSAPNGGSGKQNDSTGNVGSLRPHPSNHGKVKMGKRGMMNRTEAEYALILEAMKRKGEILRYEFEGITLRFANVKYTPDFVVIYESHTPILPDESCYTFTRTKFIEVKGPFIRGNRERAVERFRHAKTYWPEFTFEMHQKTKDGWKQII